ncbi:hypothetical protein [Chromobacterium piscinae]|uniref:hypothetical protein n=1 Tax=Chromobacterium piscinae TaxID=686831 RepID=UPI001C8C7BB7|nr:hypothetical protein [Chromobacterium vaccinii]
MDVGSVRNTQIYQSLVKNEEPKELSTTRQYLNEGTAGSEQPFGKAVNFVNENLGSHGDNNISENKARSYVEDSKKVESGDMSNSGAFANSAVGWIKEGNVTGAVMNFGGMLASGAVDKANYHKN